MRTTLAVACLLSTCNLHAQPAFEVASVKPGATREIGGVYNYPGGRVGFRGCTLEYLVEEAFDVRDFQVTGAPTWAQADRWDIDAKPPDSSPLSRVNPPYTKFALYPEQRRMLQSLLADRFHLKIQRTTKEGPVYLLVKNGKPLKLTDAKDKDAFPWSGGMSGGGLVGDGIKGANESMEDLASRLSEYLDHPVLDRTGISGSYDFRVEYSRETHPDIVAMIFAVLPELGLKLESSKGPVETIVIESVSRPSEN